MTSRVRWGQNFLVDHAVSARIVEWAAVEGSPVVEIGPGRGAITSLLAARASRLWLVEIDPELADLQRRAFADDPRVEVVEADALALDWKALVPPATRVVSNLPYESGTAIVAHLLAARGSFASLTVMLQREVADRLVAEPASRAYGALSVLTRIAADVEAGMVVAPRSFRPRPAVESRVVKLRPLTEFRYDVGDEETFRFVVRAAFGQRRKMLRNNLGRAVEARFGAGAWQALLGATGIDGERRPETLAVAEFAALSRAARGLESAPPAVGRAKATDA